MCLRPEWGTITSIPSELRNYIGALLGVSYQRLLTSRCTDFPMVLCPNPIIPWEPSAVLSRGRELPKAQVNRLGYEKMCNSIADDIHPDSQDPRVNHLRTALFTGKCFWFKVQRPVIFGRKESGSNTENTQNDEGGVQTVILVYKHSSKQTLTNTCNIYQPLPRCISPASPPLYLGRESVEWRQCPQNLFRIMEQGWGQNFNSQGPIWHSLVWKVCWPLHQKGRKIQALQALTQSFHPRDCFHFSSFLSLYTIMGLKVWL